MNRTDFDNLREKAIGNYLALAHHMEAQLKDRQAPYVLYRIRHYMERAMQETLDDIEMYVNAGVPIDTEELESIDLMAFGHNAKMALAVREEFRDILDDFCVECIYYNMEQVVIGTIRYLEECV